MGRGDFAFENDYFGIHDTKVKTQATPEQRDIEEEISSIEGQSARLTLALSEEKDEYERTNIEHDRHVFDRAVARLKKIRRGMK